MKFIQFQGNKYINLNNVVSVIPMASPESKHKIVVYTTELHEGGEYTVIRGLTERQLEIVMDDFHDFLSTESNVFQFDLDWIKQVEYWVNKQGGVTND